MKKIVYTYDERTTKMLDEFEKTLNAYYATLMANIEVNDVDYSTAIKMAQVKYMNDPIRKELIKKMSDMKALSFPISIKIVDED